MKLRRLLGLPLLACLAPLAGAQDDRLVDAEMEFARELATRFGYVDFSEDVIASLEGRQLQGSQSEALVLLKCDVYAAGAKNEPETEKRLESYDKAVEAFVEYIEDHPFSELLPQAQRNYVDLCNRYGRFLEVELDDAVGSEAQVLREKIQSVLEGALDLTGDLIDQFRGELTQVERLEKWRLMLNRGQMMLTLANVSEAGDFYYTRAEQILEELALEAGETSGPGLNAYLLLAKVKMAQGSFEDAAAFSEFVVDVVMPYDPDDRAQRWDELAFEEKAQRWKLAELGISTLVLAHQALGDDAAACKWALHYYNNLRVDGFDLTPLGHLSLLACARTLLDAGGWVGGAMNRGNLQWFETVEDMEGAGFSGGRNARSALDLALLIAQNVNDGNRGNTLQVRAQKVISDVIGRPGVTVSPDVLFEAAQGEFYANEYGRAIEAFKGILRQLEPRDDATKQEYAPKVLYHVGQSLARLDRDLEAAMAFREAATRWAGDPEYQEKCANGFYQTMRGAKAGTGGDPLLEQLYLEAENLYSQAVAETSDAGDLLFRQGERLYNDQDFPGARSKYQEVGSGSDVYEKARVKAALCLYKLKDVDGARAEFEQYLSYTEDATTRPTEAKKKRTRAEALAMATFYLGRIAYSVQDFGETLRWLKNYQEKFPGQGDYGPNALYMAVMSELANGNLAGAKQVVADMGEAYEGHPRVGSGAIQVFQALQQEMEKAEQAGDVEGAKALKGEMAVYMHLSNELDAEPSFKNLRSESVLWVELEAWEEAEAALRKMLAAFEGDAEVQADVESFVLPDLGRVLLAQKRVPEAFEVLDPLIPKDESDTRKPRPLTVRTWCRAVSGWVEGDAQNVVEVPGVGGAGDLKIACEFLLQLTNVEKRSGAGDWTCPWYELKFETGYAYYQWGQLDSNQIQNATGLIKNLMDLLGDPRLDDISANCGDDLLKRRFLWLWEKVR